VSDVMIVVDVCIFLMVKNERLQIYFSTKINWKWHIINLLDMINKLIDEIVRLLIILMACLNKNLK